MSLLVCVILQLEVDATPGVLDSLQLRADSLRALLRDRRRRAEGFATALDVRNCYRYLLGREPDAAGYRGYVRDLSARPTPLVELVDAFLTSEEFLDRQHQLRRSERAEFDRVELHAGYHIYVDRDDVLVGAQLRRAQAYEQKLSDRLAELCVPGAVFVDVGASIGIFSVMAGRLVGPTGHVVAIEPGPQNQALLLLNIASNGLDNVETFACAASDASLPVLYGHFGGNGYIRPFDGDTALLSRFDLVAARPLDVLLAGQRRVDVVKIDVEGAEGRVLRGARQLFEQATATVFFELSPPALAARSSMEAVEFLATIMDFGYRFDVLTESGDDLVDLSVARLLEIFTESGLEHLDVVARPRGGS